jgi:hypothetical protein
MNGVDFSLAPIRGHFGEQNFPVIIFYSKEPTNNSVRGKISGPNAGHEENPRPQYLASIW